MHIRNGLQAIRNIVSSGAKYIALSSYPPGKQPPSHSRSIGKNETLPAVLSACDQEDYCQLGSIADGNMYFNKIDEELKQIVQNYSQACLKS